MPDVGGAMFTPLGLAFCFFPFSNTPRLSVNGAVPSPSQPVPCAVFSLLCPLVFFRRSPLVPPYTVNGLP